MVNRKQNPLLCNLYLFNTEKALILCAFGAKKFGFGGNFMLTYGACGDNIFQYAPAH